MQTEHLYNISADLEGQTLHQYQLTQKVGVGGMAWVYHAMDTAQQREVALKILFNNIASDEEKRRRFLQEAKIQQDLDHPHIVRVYAHLNYPDFVGLSMEWCNSGDLAQWQQSQQRLATLADVQQLFMPLLDAMQHAHDRGLIHRDIKPQNVLLHQDHDQALQPKLTDFGIAKLGAEGMGLTQTGDVFGTLEYASPEQLRDSKRVDKRSDIYSLGVLLYQLCTGRLPFRGSIAEIMRSVLSQKDAPPPFEAPFPLQTIITQSIAKDPRHRYATIVELQRALQAALQSSLPTIQRNPSFTGEPSPTQAPANAVTVTFDDAHPTLLEPSDKYEALRTSDGHAQTAVDTPVQQLLPRPPTNRKAMLRRQRRLLGFVILLLCLAVGLAAVLLFRSP